MTVGELIAILQQYKPEDKVYTAYPSGDYWRTTCVVEVDRVGIEVIRRSEYHGTYKICDDGNGEDALIIG